jgi:hypothetical protein
MRLVTGKGLATFLPFTSKCRRSKHLHSRLWCRICRSVELTRASKLGYTLLNVLVIVRERHAGERRVTC